MSVGLKDLQARSGPARRELCSDHGESAATDACNRDTRFRFSADRLLPGCVRRVRTAEGGGYFSSTSISTVSAGNSPSHICRGARIQSPLRLEASSWHVPQAFDVESNFVTLRNDHHTLHTCNWRTSNTKFGRS